MESDEYKMLEEIKQQAALIRHIVENKASPEMQRITILLQQNLDNYPDLYLIGSGTSYHSCVFASYLFSLKNKAIVNIYRAGEFDSYVGNLSHRSLVIMVSQSGESGDVLRLAAPVKKSGAHLVAMTNDINSALAKQAHAVVPLMAGSVQAVPSTKAFISEITIFSLISELLGVEGDFSHLANNIAQDIERMVGGDYYEKIKSLAGKLAGAEIIYVLGHATDYANAFEAALKIKECSKIPAEASSALEFRHGAIALASSATPVIMFLTNRENTAEINRVVSELKAKGAEIIGIGVEPSDFYSDFYQVADNGIYSAISGIVPAQILAFELALAKGLNPDKPEGVNQIVR